jgi:hypothetical protein
MLGTAHPPPSVGANDPTWTERAADEAISLAAVD